MAGVAEVLDQLEQALAAFCQPPPMPEAPELDRWWRTVGGMFSAGVETRLDMELPGPGEGDRLAALMARASLLSTLRLYTPEGRPKARILREGGGFPLGGVLLWPAATAPDKWHACDGQECAPGFYPEMEAALGLTEAYQLPDYRGYWLVCAGDTFAIGGSGGLANHNHNGGLHLHAVDVTSQNFDVTDLTNAYFGDMGTQWGPFSMNTHTHPGVQFTGNSGQAEPNLSQESNDPPWLALHFMVKTGVFAG